LWIGILVVWIFWNYFYHKDHVLYAQKTLTLIPLFKSLEICITAAFIANCPWNPADSNLKYLDMARISIITIACTIYLALFYIISQGWNVVTFALTRD